MAKNEVSINQKKEVATMRKLQRKADALTKLQEKIKAAVEELSGMIADQTEHLENLGGEAEKPAKKAKKAKAEKPAKKAKKAKAEKPAKKAKKAKAEKPAKKAKAEKTSKKAKKTKKSNKVAVADFDDFED